MNNEVLIPGDNLQAAADLSVESERLRLGHAGFGGFFAIAAEWNLTDDQARQLLDLQPEDRLEEIKVNPDPQLFTEERLMRIGCVIGIYRGLQTYCGLNTYFGENIAVAWITRPNLDPMFGGLSPVEHMIRGGLDAIFEVRRQTDAWCGGN